MSTPASGPLAATLACLLLGAQTRSASATSAGFELPAAARPAFPAWLRGTARSPALPARERQTLRVDRCDDGAGAGTLRDAIAHAADGDAIDLSALACSVITLGHGQLDLPQRSLSLKGPTSHALAIDGGDASRVFDHTGSGELILSDLVIRHGRSYRPDGQSPNGGCIQSAGSLTLVRSTVTDCIAVDNNYSASGGAVSATHRITLVDSVVSHSSAALAGGMMCGDGINATASSIHVARYGPGGFGTFGAAAFAYSTVSGNAGQIGGGGHAGQSLALWASTISGNTATIQGGGVIAGASGSTVYSSTIACNAAPVGGGLLIESDPATLMLSSSIVAGNVAEHGSADIASTGPGFSISGNHNLVQSTTLALPPQTLRVDPRLLPLADNGGRTLTHALARESPAIDAGSLPQAFVWDQRGEGFARVSGAAPDIGTYEVHGPDTILADGFDG